MKKLLGLLFCTLSLTACDGLTDREESCLDNVGTWDSCTYEGRKHQQEMARIEARTPTVQGGYDDYDYDYPEVEANREYTNYYGDPRYGSWNNGSYHFTNPHGQYASSTNSFLVGAGIGGLLGYMGTKAAMRASWDNANPNGYTERKNTISKKELKRRKEQSKRDKAKYRKARAKKQAKLNKKNKAKLNKKKQNKKFSKKKVNRKVKQKASKKKQFATQSVYVKSKKKSKKRSSSKKKRK